MFTRSSTLKHKKHPSHDVLALAFPYDATSSPYLKTCTSAKVSRDVLRPRPRRQALPFHADEFRSLQNQPRISGGDRNKMSTPHVS